MVKLSDWLVTFGLLYKFSESLSYLTLAKLKTSIFTMFATSQRSSGEALLPVVAMLFLFMTKGQTTDSTSAPAVTNSSVSTHPSNISSAMAVNSHRPCSDNASFCANDGQCIYPQDSHKPACICKYPYGGERCIIIVDLSQSRSESEQLIGIVIGMIMTLFVLALIVYCCFHKRCFKLGPPKKSSPETPV